MNRGAWRTYEHYAYATLATVGTAAAVSGVYWFVIDSPWSAWVHTLGSVAAPLSNIVGVLFGLTLAFLANDTWTAHDRAKNAVLCEADSLRSLQILCGALPAACRGELAQALLHYAQASVAEWRQLARRETSATASDRSDRLLSLIAAPAVGAGAGGTIQLVMLQQVTVVRASRDQRIALSQIHVNPLKWLGMAFLGFLTLVFIAVIEMQDARAALTAMMLFALAAAPTAAIVLIHGNPFQPPSAVSPAPLASALSPAATELADSAGGR